MINIWVDIINDDVPAESCFLSQTDSSSAAGWLRKSNFAEKTETMVQLTTARQLATLMINAKSRIYSQWFAGELNVVSNCLHHDFHLNDSELTNFIQSRIPIQTPFGFFLSPLPTEICSWLTCLLQNQPPEEEWSKEPQRSKLSLGNNTNSTCYPSELKMTGSSIPSPEDKNTRYSGPSPHPSAKVDFVLENLLNSKVTQLEPPWIAYHRPLSWLTDQTQGWTKTATLHSFYSANYDATKV
jgi:hypothetical protein